MVFPHATDLPSVAAPGRRTVEATVILARSRVLRCPVPEG